MTENYPRPLLLIFGSICAVGGIVLLFKDSVRVGGAVIYPPWSYFVAIGFSLYGLLALRIFFKRKK